MGLVLKICVLLLVLELYALANPVIPQSGELSAQKSTIRKLFMLDGEADAADAADPAAPAAPAAPAEGGAAAAPAAGTATTVKPATTTDTSRSSLTVPSVIISVAALMPVLIANKLRDN